MTTIKAMLADQEREFEVLGYATDLADGNWRGTTHYMSGDAGAILPTPGKSMLGHVLRLRLVMPTHTFGGVVFEEVSHGAVLHDEWYLYLGKPVYWKTDGPSNQHYPILRPVRLA